MGYGRIEQFVVFTAAEWAASDLILHTFEGGLESDTGKMKHGNGLDLFSALSYIPGIGGGGGGDMLSANNLSDVASIPTSRLNILPSIGGNAGKFLRVNLAGTDYDLITLAGGGDLLAANNLSDVANAATSLANLGGISDISGFTTTDLSEGTNLYFTNARAVTALTGQNVSIFTNDAGYLVSNTPIVGATKTKITYDADGLVTAGADATTGDIADSLNKRYVTDAQLVVIGNTSGTNTGDQTSIVGITGTKDQFNTSLSDGDFLFVGDITQYTDEMAQDAIGAMIDASLNYVDGTPLLQRAALTGAITASAGSNSTALGSFTKADLTAAVSDGDPLYVGDVTQYTDEMAQDATGAMCTDGSLVYTDATPLLKVAGGAVSFFLSGVQTDTTSTGNIDDYALNADVTELRFDSNVVNIALRSMVGGVEGRIVTVRNVHATCLVTVSNDTGAGTAANKFYCHNTITLTQYYGATFKYNATLQRWVLLAIDMVYSSSATDLLGSMVQPTIRTNAVTYAKMQDVSAASKLIGRGSAAGGGDPEEITLGTNLAMSSTTVNAQSVSTSGVGQNPTSSSTQTITHGLGFTPKIIRIYGIGPFTNNAAAVPVPFSMGVWNSSGNRCVYMTHNGTSAQASQTSTTFAIFLATSAGNTISGVIGNVTSTQFDIVWTEVGTALAQNYMWEAE